MTPEDLFDKIETWNAMYEQIPLPAATNPAAEQIRQQTIMELDASRLRNAAELEVIDELKGTPVEADLASAIREAKSGDASKLNSMYTRLLRVQEYMHKHRIM